MGVHRFQLLFGGVVYYSFGSMNAVTDGALYFVPDDPCGEHKEPQGLKFVCLILKDWQINL